MLPSAKSGVLVEPSRRRTRSWWRYAALMVGMLAVLVGAADALSRIASAVGADMHVLPFAPAILLVDPELRENVKGAYIESFLPKTISVPALSIEAAVEPVGVRANGAMDTPKAIQHVAWYRYGARPGEPGNAVFAGHLNNSFGVAGVFSNLSSATPGYMVVVRGSEGEELRYVIESVREYALKEAPLEEIFSVSGPSRLVLITCEGTWDAEARTYDKRLVVTARLAF